MKQKAGAATRSYQSAHAGSAILDIVVAIFDATIIDLLKVQEVRARAQLDQEFELLRRASHRMLGLRAALNQQIAGSLIGYLARFYLTTSFQIMAIPRRRDPRRAAERLIAQMRAMREAWREVAARQVGLGHEHVDAGLATDLNVLL